jgi:hypothetical protein
MKYLFSAKGYRKLRSESQIKNRISEIEDDWKRISSIEHEKENPH